MALAGGLAKGVAKNIVKKPKVNTKKFFDDVKETKEKSADSKPAGALVPSPGGSIVKVVDVKVDAEKKIKGETGDPLIREVSIIYQRTIDIQKALRKEQKAKRKRAKKKLRDDKKKKRGLRERLSEMGAGAGKAVMGTAAKAAQPITSLWGNIMKAFSFIMIGWLSRYLPQILGFAKTIVDGISAVGKFLTPIVTPVWDAFIWISTKGTALISKLLGTDPDEADNKTLLGNIADIQKKTGLIEKAFAVFIISDAAMAIAQLVEGFNNFREQSRWWRQSRVWRRRLWRRVTTPGVRNAIRNRFNKPISNLVKRVKPRQFIQNQGGKLLQNVQQRGGSFLQRLGRTGGSLFRAGPEPAWVQRGLGALKGGKNWLVKGSQSNVQKLGRAGQWALSKGSQLLDDGINLTRNLTSGLIRGVQTKLTNFGKTLTGLKDLAGKKWEEALKKKILPKINNIIKNNPLLNKLQNLKPANARGAVQKIFQQVAKSPATKKTLSVLKRIKGTPGLGPMEVLISSIIGGVQYAGLGESPINVIVKLLGGLLGYAGGMAIVSAIPGAAATGYLPLVGGMVGSLIGDFAADKLLGVLAKSEWLTTTPDPIMGDADEKAGRPARPLLRDPSGALVETEEQKKTREESFKMKVERKYSQHFDQETGILYINNKPLSVEETNKFINMSEKEKLIQYGRIKSQTTEHSISESASYDKKETGGTIINVPIEEMKASSGGSGGSKTIVTTEGLNKLKSAEADQTLRTKSKLYANG